MGKQRGSRLIKNSVFDLFNTAFMFGTSWIISIWVARQLGPDNYGIFTLILWLTGTFSWVIGMGLIHAVTKFIAEYSGKEENHILGSIVLFVMKIEIALSLVISCILIFFQTEIANYFFTPSESFFFFLAFLGIIPGVITAIFSATIEGIQKFEYFTYASLLITPVSFTSKIIVLLLGKGISGLLTVMLFFSIINSLFYFFVLTKEKIKLWPLNQPIGNTLKARIKKYNLSVLAIILCDKIIWDKSENFFLGRFCNASEIGFYNLGFNISKKFSAILPSTFWRVLFPAMSNYCGTGDHAKTKRLFFIATRYLAFAAFPIGVGGAILAYQIIHYLYGHDYIGAQRILQIMFLSSILTSLCEPGAAILYGYEKQSFIYKLGAVMAVVNIILDIFLIKRYGALGAACCYAITTVVGSICGTVYTCRTMKLKYPIVSIAKIFFATVVMGLSMEIILLQNSEIPGFFLSLIIGGIIYIISSLILGTIEDEDYIILESIKQACPGKIKILIDGVIGFIMEFKKQK
ncbi:MAG: flippase [Chitinispirillia bacterium]|jgi:O-antigen/teichoic acid export membrane protein